MFYFHGRGRMYQQITLAQHQLDAYNARDIDRFLECYADGIQLMNFPDNTVFCSGKEEMRTRYGKMFEDKQSLHCRLVKRIVCGDFAIDEEEVDGLVDGRIVHATAIYEVRDNLIQKAWFIRGE